MVEKEGKIVEISEYELFRLYIDREMDEIMAFPDYVNSFKRCGCKIKE